MALLSPGSFLLWLLFVLAIWPLKTNNDSSWLGQSFMPNQKSLWETEMCLLPAPTLQDGSRHEDDAKSQTNHPVWLYLTLDRRRVLKNLRSKHKLTVLHTSTQDTHPWCDEKLLLNSCPLSKQGLHQWAVPAGRTRAFPQSHSGAVYLWSWTKASLPKQEQG